MSSEVVPVRSARLARQVGRELEQVQAAAVVEIARVRAVETVECCKIEALGTAADVAKRELARLDLVEAGYAALGSHGQAGMQVIQVRAVVEIDDRIRKMNRRLG
jgi:hypothetical protein